MPVRRAIFGFALWLSVFLALAARSIAQEPPVALVIAGDGAQAIRAGSGLPMSVKPGELLFAADKLLNGGATLTLVSCYDSKRLTLVPNAELTLDAGPVKVKPGKIVEEKSALGCFLPPLPRSIVASEQHGGASLAQDRAIDSRTLEQRMQALTEEQRQSLTNDLRPFPRPDDPDPLSHLARAAVLEKYGLFPDAVEEMRRVSAAWPDAAWARSRLFILEEKMPRPPPPPEEEGETFALLIGISSFQDRRIPALQFAHEDAINLSQMLHSARGGGIPSENIVLLTNEKATTNAIRDAIETHLKGRAKKNDTVLLFIASHGAVVPVKNRDKGFVITYDTSAEDPAASAIPMDDIHKIFEYQLSSVRRLYLYVDVCHAGQVGQIFPKADALNKTAERVLTAEDVQMFGMLAAQKNQVAAEGVIYGGGHGAFTYFLLRALNGDADLNSDGKVTMDEMAQFVVDKVGQSTANRQIPKTVGEIDEHRVLAFTGKPGIELKEYAGQGVVASRGFSPIPGVSQQAQDVRRIPILTSRDLRYQAAASLLEQFERAIRENRLSQTAGDSAFTYLPALKAKLDSDQYRREADKLRLALEDKGQEVLLRYLAGEETPQKPEDFLAGQIYFEAAEFLAPDSLYLQSRAIFCQGRLAVFNKDYKHAADLLERAIRLDPDRGYSYNALGIAYLEQADYEQAILAFREASKRAPYWAYPLHNMALAYSEKGDDERAIETYQRAMRLAPKVAYLPYNLGLLMQRMNRPKDAELLYQKALSLAPDSLPVLNALGYLRATLGKTGQAESYYRMALGKDPEFLAARHNLALLLAATPQRTDEAIQLWRENLAKAESYVPSRLSLARALARKGEKDQAAREYLRVIEAKPDYGAARLALAEIYMQTGSAPAALQQLQEALSRENNSAEILERIGDAYVALRRNEEARAAYQRVLELSGDGLSKKRIRSRLKAIP